MSQDNRWGGKQAGNVRHGRIASVLQWRGCPRPEGNAEKESARLVPSGVLGDPSVEFHWETLFPIVLFNKNKLFFVRQTDFCPTKNKAGFVFVPLFRTNLLNKLVFVRQAGMLCQTKLLFVRQAKCLCQTKLLVCSTKTIVLSNEIC